MWLRILLLAGILTLNNMGTLYAANSSNLRLNISPLDCLTDVVDDGLNIYQYEEDPYCGEPTPDPTPQNPAPEPVPEIVAGVTYISNSGAGTEQLTTSPGKVDVVYHAKFNGLNQRQSVLKTLVISIGTISFMSMIAFILRFL